MSSDDCRSRKSATSSRDDAATYVADFRRFKGLRQHGTMQPRPFCWLSITSRCSATNFLSFAFSRSKPFNLTDIGNLYIVVLISPLEETLLGDVIVTADPESRSDTSASRKTRILCSSEKRLFICKPSWSEDSPIKRLHERSRVNRLDAAAAFNRRWWNCVRYRTGIETQTCA
jgi:hypothetical protein